MEVAVNSLLALAIKALNYAGGSVIYGKGEWQLLETSRSSSKLLREGVGRVSCAPRLTLSPPLETMYQLSKTTVLSLILFISALE